MWWSTRRINEPLVSFLLCAALRASSAVSLRVSLVRSARQSARFVLGVVAPKSMSSCGSNSWAPAASVPQ